MQKQITITLNEVEAVALYKILKSDWAHAAHMRRIRAVVTFALIDETSPKDKSELYDKSKSDIHCNMLFER